MMSFFTTIYTSQRLKQTGSKSDYIDYGKGRGFLKPMDAYTASINSIQYGQGFKFFIDVREDIATTDKLTIGGDTYEVRGVMPVQMGSVQVNECTIVKKKI